MPSLSSVSSVSSVSSAAPSVFPKEAVSHLDRLYSVAMANREQDLEDLAAVLSAEQIPLLLLLETTRKVREHFCGKDVRLHILNNLQNGGCTEDCNYCAQATSSSAEIETYSLKDDASILSEAQNTAESGASRYCMVMSGTGPSIERTKHLAELVAEIKKRHKIEVCISAGFINETQAKILKEAGLDRYNHNLNTSGRFYEKICSTHTYAERVKCLEIAKGAGLELCSGLIVGMGESTEDILSVASTLRKLAVKSVPVNFYMHIPGSKLGEMGALTPEQCLRILCLFRLALPTAEIRAAGGREINLRSLQPFCLYAANSLFCDGYLNSSGQSVSATTLMIHDAGFTVGSIES